jgi:hypothetical protein
VPLATDLYLLPEKTGTARSAAPFLCITADISLYSVIQEERSIFWEVIISVIERRKFI